MKRALLIFVIISLMFLILRQTSASFFSHTKYYFTQKGFLSNDYFSLIKKNAEQLFTSNCSAHNIIAYLKNEFPVLNKIIIAYYPHGVYTKVYTHELICCINDELVLTTQDALYPKHFFAMPFKNTFPNITVNQDFVTRAASLAPSLLRELPFDFYETHDIELCNEHTVRLVNKQEKNFVTVLSANQKNVSHLLAHCETVKKRICEQKNYGAKNTWVCDARFSDYIVAYKV